MGEEPSGDSEPQPVVNFTRHARETEGGALNRSVRIFQAASGEPGAGVGLHELQKMRQRAGTHDGIRIEQPHESWRLLALGGGANRGVIAPRKAPVPREPSKLGPRRPAVRCDRRLDSLWRAVAAGVVHHDDLYGP